MSHENRFTHLGVVLSGKKRGKGGKQGFGRVGVSCGWDVAAGCPTWLRIRLASPPPPKLRVVDTIRGHVGTGAAGRVAWSEGGEGGATHRVLHVLRYCATLARPGPWATDCCGSWDLALTP